MSNNNRQREMPTVRDIERAERLKFTLEALYEINKTVPVIVEGKKDAAALRSLGLVGDIITLHRGKNIYDFSADIEERFSKIVILLDWDKNGNTLNRALSENLKGRWEEFSWFRDLIRLLCQKDISTVEGIPKLLKRLEGDEKTWY